MTTMTANEQLRAAMDQLASLKFPDHPDDPDLAEWVLDLAELDGHIAGLATTALASGRRSSGSLVREARDHRARLDGIGVVGEDEVIYEQCVAYAAALERVERALGGDTAG